MKKLMKMFITIMSVVLVISINSVAYAESLQDNNVSTTEEYSLSNLAEDVIKKEKVDDETLLYLNIDEFTEQAKSKGICNDDLELGTFIAKYTNQYSDVMEKADLCDYVNYSKIYSSESVIKSLPNGKSTLISEQQAKEEILIDSIKAKSLVGVISNGSWTSPNGYMKIDTSANVSKKNKKKYKVSSTAKWLKMPVCHSKDVLAIYNTGTFDDSVTESGYVKEVLECCKNKYTYQAYGKDKKNAKFEYPKANIVDLRFQLVNTSTYTCNNVVANHSKTVKSIQAYLSYGIILKPGETYNVQGAYCHKRVGAGSISVSISGGGPSFGASFGTQIDEYKARPITVKA